MTIGSIINFNEQQTINESDDFASLFANSEDFYKEFSVENNETTVVDVEETAGFDFENFLTSLSQEEDLDIRELMILELKRQGVSDPVAYLGKGGIDITLRTV